MTGPVTTHPSRRRHDLDTLRNTPWSEMTTGQRISAVRSGLVAAGHGRNQYARDWRNANPEKVEATKRRYRYRDTERFRALDAAAKRRRRLGRNDPDTKAYVAVLTADPCSYCGGAGTQIDHIVPVASEGPNHWSNYTAACGSCNAAKKDRSLLSHLRRAA